MHWAVEMSKKFSLGILLRNQTQRILAGTDVNQNAIKYRLSTISITIILVIHICLPKMFLLHNGTH